uniref:U2A'/phosphoprotein 32 family A C-terminal domain-containing protein n=1 Tax=Ciona savignyi TaxID=51511 RepID=H2YJZ7_CIOSA
MKSLRILNLHDNGIGKLEDIQSLCVCVNLVVLTLYDTPLSLKANYRHHTVNSIWSLKALDHHVIGDEEIIEDSLFSKRFTAMNPKLFVDLCPKQNEALNDRTLQSEMKTVRKILSDINRILVHGSPVVVIQRWVRGHLSRKALGISYMQVQERLRKLNFVPQTTPSGSQVDEVLSLDYDTYLKNRRPGSKTPSASTTMRAESPATRQSRESRDIKMGDSPLKILPTSL